jgi:ABC-type glycerol-3-phosphate transport system substrate-binding protein
MLNAGAQLIARTDALVPLDSAVVDIKGDLAGWPDFSGTDGHIYAIPLSIQGFVAYYNKKLYSAAGLDPNKPPTTWAEMVKVCDAIKAKGAATCFSLGNKEGFGMETWFSPIAATEWTAQEQADFTAGKLKWSSPQVKAVLQSWADANAAGWFPKGANSTPKFPDEYESFMRGDSANSMGLISDVGNWKQFDDFMGSENVGAFRLPSPTIASDKKEGDPQFPVTGGIGYGVNKASKNIDLAIALNREFATAANEQIFFQDAGAIPANTKVDISNLTSPSGKLIFAWMKTSEAPMAYSDATAAEVEELHRQSQLLLNGEVTVDQAAARLDEVQAQARKK